MKQRVDSTWQFFNATTQTIKTNDVTQTVCFNRFYNKDLTTLLQSNNKKKLALFAESLQNMSSLTNQELEKLSYALWQWTLNLQNTKQQEINSDINSSMTKIAVFAVNQFNALEELDWSLWTSNDAHTLSATGYHLAILNQAQLDTPSISTLMLNKVGDFITKSDRLNSKIISNFIASLGLFSKYQQVDPLQLNTSLLHALLTLLANLEWKKLNTKDIAKCFYSLSLLAKANCLNHFKLELEILQPLLFIQINLPPLQTYRWAIETSLYSLVILVEYGILNVNDTDEMVLETLRAGRLEKLLAMALPPSNNEEVDNLYWPSEIQKQCLGHLGLFNSKQSTEDHLETHSLSSSKSL